MCVLGGSYIIFTYIFTYIYIINLLLTKQQNHAMLRFEGVLEILHLDSMRLYI